jgi:putative transcriptional regulator
VFRGGPVAPNSALALAMVPGKDEPVGWRALDGAPALARLGLLDLDTPPRLLAPAITSLRVYAGYSGWSPGQLEAEIDEGAWYVLTAQPGDVFAADPDRLWRQVLRRQDGDMAFLATYPDDPSQNLPGGRPPDPPMSGSAGPNDFGLLARGERLRARGVRGPARRAAGPSRETVSFGT